MKSVVSHSDPEMLLIRIGHHLWRWRKAAMREGGFSAAYPYMCACESVWEAKREYRQPRQERNAATEKRRKLRKIHQRALEVITSISELPR
jgi:hypothetical protein